jgi:hypothetical protein
MQTTETEKINIGATIAELPTCGFIVDAFRARFDEFRGAGTRADESGELVAECCGQGAGARAD